MAAPLTFQVLDLKRQKKLPFTLKENIEEGSFGKVFLVDSPAYKETLIGKTIDLEGRGFNIQYSPFHLLRSTYREIAYLQQLDLLVGYQHDKEHKKMLIIMKHLPGVPEFRVKKNKRLAEFASFCALRDLHRKGIAHMDPHQYNFIYDEKTETAHAIDFGLAQDSGPFRQLRDFEQFLKLRRAPPSFTSSEGRETIAHFIDLYCTELKDYILAHRYETAQHVFCYAAVIIAALSGASVLGVASLLAQELIKATVL
ncbi:MAG: AarF/UbiB family protein, partial [Candidatus Berkiella sp.]